MTNEQEVASLTPEMVLREAHRVSGYGNPDHARILLEIYDRLVGRELRPVVDITEFLEKEASPGELRALVDDGVRSFMGCDTSSDVEVARVFRGWVRRACRVLEEKSA